MRGGLLAVLAAVVLLAAWDRVRVEPKAPGVPPSPEREATDEEEPGTPEILPPQQALSLERHPEALADEVGSLSRFRSTLEWQVASWRDELGVDFQVVTYAGDAPDIETLATDVFGLRRVGDDAPTGGILLVLNPTLREARFEVSYQLEGSFPDALLARIAEDQLVPYVAYSAVGMAVMDVLQMLKDQVYLRAIRGGLELDAAYKQRPTYLEKERFLSGGGGASVDLPDLAELGDRDLKAPVPVERRGRYAPAEDPIESVEALLRVNRDLAGDPTLPLFTEGSQCQKRGYPFAPYEELERLRILEASRPWTVDVQGDRAVVSSRRPAHGFVPVLLQRVDGTWRVDIVETWKNLFFSESGNFHLANHNNPYLFGLGAFGEGRHQDIAAYDLGDASIDEVLARLGEAPGALEHYLKGEVLFRNCFLALDAITHYEEAVRLAPTGSLFLETLGDRAFYLGFYAIAKEAYMGMGAEGLAKLARTHAKLGDWKAAIARTEDWVQRDRYDLAALTQLAEYLEKAGQGERAAGIRREMALLREDPLRRSVPVRLSVDPPNPTYHIDTPTKVGDVLVHDHSNFGVTLTNDSGRTVEIERVKTLTVGSESKSGLGDIKDYWSWAGDRTLEPGQSIHFDKIWGFVVDTGHDQLSYVFDLCWRGEGDKRQCRHTRLDLLPR